MARRLEQGGMKAYAAAFGFAILSVAFRRALDLPLGNGLPYVTHFAAVAAAAWYGGIGPGILALVVCGAASTFFHLAPRGTLWIDREADALGLGLFLVTGFFIVWIAEQTRRTQARAEESAQEALRQREWLKVTLRSIGDAVIATDEQARVTFLNGVAEALTGWTTAEAAGRPLGDVFVIFNEMTGKPVDDPVAKVLAEGKVVGLANHTILRSKDGQEYPIDDSAAPIRDDDGSIRGVVLVFRDVTEERRAQQIVARSEASYRALADGLGLIVWSCNREGQLEYLNKHWAEYTGLGKGTNEARRWMEVIHPDDIEPVSRAWAEALKTGSPYEFEYRIRRESDRSYRWHLGRVRPIHDEQGRVIRWFGTGIDIEDRKHTLEALQAGEERLRLALEAGRMGTWDFDIAAGLVKWSTGLELIHGLAPGTFPGTFEAYQRDIRPEDIGRVLNSIHNAVEKGHEHHLEYRIVWPDQTIHWIEARGKPIVDSTGKVSRLLGICMDVTARKRQEEELRNALGLAEEAARARDQFLAMLSHELRTPLSPVLLAADELLSFPDLDHERRELLTAIHQNVELEVRLIDDLLDVMRIVRGKLPFRFETADLHELMRRTLDICRADAEAKSLTLSYEPEADRHLVLADPARLQQVLWNLVKNAVKFTPKGGIIRVRNWIEQGGDRIGVEVKDTGIGIDPPALTRIFNAFEQEEDSVTARFGGLGLGLAICKSIVEAHGGNLAAWSEGKGKGTTVWFTIPLYVAPADAGNAGQAASPSPSAATEPFKTRGLRLLLVEDDPMTARIMAKLLRRNGYEVITANTIAVAAAVPIDSFDLMISDIGLPDGNGLELMQALMEHRQVPAIALTGYGREDDVRKCLAAGFVAHLTKPVDFARLDAMIRRVAAEFDGAATSHSKATGSGL